MLTGGLRYHLQSKDTDQSYPSKIFSELSQGEGIVVFWRIPPLLGKTARLSDIPIAFS